MNNLNFAISLAFVVVIVSLANCQKCAAAEDGVAVDEDTVEYKKLVEDLYRIYNTTAFEEKFGFHLDTWLLERDLLGKSLLQCGQKLEWLSHAEEVVDTVNDGVQIAAGATMLVGALGAVETGGASLVVFTEAAQVSGYSELVDLAFHAGAEAVIKYDDFQENAKMDDRNNRDKNVIEFFEKIENRTEIVRSIDETKLKKLHNEFVHHSLYWYGGINLGSVQADGQMGYDIGMGMHTLKGKYDKMKTFEAALHEWLITFLRMSSQPTTVEPFAKEMKIPSFIPMIGGKVLIKAGSSAARQFAKVSAGIGLAASIYSAVDDAKRLKTMSERAEFWIHWAKAYNEMTANIREDTKRFHHTFKALVKEKSEIPFEASQLVCIKESGNYLTHGTNHPDNFNDSGDTTFNGEFITVQDEFVRENAQWRIHRVQVDKVERVFITPSDHSKVLAECKGSSVRRANNVQYVCLREYSSSEETPTWKLEPVHSLRKDSSLYQIIRNGRSLHYEPSPSSTSGNFAVLHDLADASLTDWYIEPCPPPPPPPLMKVVPKKVSRAKLRSSLP